MIKIEITRDDVINAEADVLLLKHAQSLYGADESVFLRLSQADVCRSDQVCLNDGEAVLVDTNSAIQAKKVLFLGTPPLRQLRYREIWLFAKRAIEKLSKQLPDVATIATTIHGAGYGLDISESFRNMIFGFQQGLTTYPLKNLKRIVFVERNTRRFEMLENAVGDVELVLPNSTIDSIRPRETEVPVMSPPPISKIVFVAMPFSDAFEDVYQFGIYQTVHKCGYICEKVDESIYSGSIIDRIIAGIQSSEFIVADLTEARPNVYLEVGFAWGLNKPVILIAKEGERLHFDLSHHKCLFYKSIRHLAEVLEKTIRELSFSKSHRYA
jgi:hypothetical protein